jgi:PAS domain S-box-containing protein
VLAAIRAGPVAAALLLDGVVVEASDAFASALGLAPGEVLGRRLDALLPPEHGPIPTARPGATRSFRTVLDGVAARVDVAVAPASAAGRELSCVVLAPQLEEPDTAASRAILALSRELAEARTEDDIVAALARALELLFPGRCSCIRLVHPATLAPTKVLVRGRLRPGAGARVALRRAAVRKTGLSEEALVAGGVLVRDRDEPMFEGCEAASSVPLVVAGQLFGVLDLDYPRGGPGDPGSDAPLLIQLANHAALGVRNLRSLEDVTYLKNYLEDLIEHANALIWVVNRQREVIVWNAAMVALTGLAKEAVLGDDVLGFVAEEDRPGVEAVLLRGFDGEHVDGHELRVRKGPGGEARIAANTAPIRGASGEVEGVIAIGQDLTRLRSLEAAAEHAERLAGIGRLAAGVVHELNNPLTAVTMYSDALLEKLGAAGHDPGDLEKLRAIRDAALRIQRLARDLTAYARPAGVRTEPCDVAGVMEEAARMAKPALKEADAQVVRRYDPAPPVEASRASLVQVFVNLITNAAQGLKEGGGTITLALAGDAEGVRAIVTDDGTGMTPDVAARAFEPFFTTRTGRGIGLGLPIVQGILQRYGGTIRLESSPGAGTRATVRIPVRRGR